MHLDYVEKVFTSRDRERIARISSSAMLRQVISYCGEGMIPCRALAVVESRTPGSGGNIPNFIPNISR